MLPSRFVCAEPSPRVLRFGEFLKREDPMADAVITALVGFARAEQETMIRRMLSPDPGALPAALQELHDWMRTAPLWFDEARADEGGALLLRHGLLAGLVLGFKSLVLGYCSPAGNKPLVFSGRLTVDVNRRLAETARFVEAVSHPGGLRFGAPGFITTVRVRLIHARVRHALRHHPGWQAADWGAPINQYDMVGTALLFSSVLLDGLRDLGASVSAQEEDAVLHQWRFIGRLMGVDQELLATSASEARSMWLMLETTQALPDADSRTLTHALILDGAERGAPPAATNFGYSLCRHLVGPRYADALGLPRGKWDLAPRALRHLVRPLGKATRRIPAVQAQALRWGARHWRRTVELTFGNSEVRFELPRDPIALSRS